MRPRRLRFFSRLIKPGELCFDVGAHVGELTANFVELGGRVVCVEPQPACVEALKAKQAANIVAIVEAALCSEEGTATLYLADLNVASTLSNRFQDVLQNSTISDWFRGRHWDQEISVKTTTLDALIARYGMPSFCKIDVEGFEDKVIGGLSRPIPRLSLEFTSEDLSPLSAALDRLDSLGDYRYNFSNLNHYSFELKLWCNSDYLRTQLQRVSSPVATGDVYAVCTKELAHLGFSPMS